MRILSVPHSSMMVALLAMWLLTAVGVAQDQRPDSADTVETLATPETIDAETLRRLELLQDEVTRSVRMQLEVFPEIRATDPDAISRWSARGDLYFFLGRFAEAVGDYQMMVQKDAAQDASHWRLGIARFYAGQPAEAAAQFDRYHAFDNIDRENGIWRYLSHYRAAGADQARAQLLRYEKDDRPPFPEVYRLFDGSLSSREVLDAVGPDLPESDRQSRLFYSYLYIGLNDAVCGRPEQAKAALAQAVINPWPRTAGYGPRYMWHVGRLHFFELNRPRAGM